jgi:predicted amidohydrolase YtcJ
MTGRADLVISGRVATLAGESGFGWSRGIAIADGRIVEYADDLESAERWSLPDDLVAMPGITDAHLHLVGLVLAESQVNLTGLDLDGALTAIARTHTELVERGDTRGWVQGHGWSLHAFGRWPDADMLEKAAAGRPIALYSHDHHARWLSRAALRLAGIGEAADPPGGMIRRDEAGTPTGILHETAGGLVDDAIPDPSPAELEAGLGRVAASLAALGLAGCHDPGELGSDTQIKRGPLFYRALAAAGRLPLRVHASIRAPQLERAIELGLVSGQEVATDGDPADPVARRLAKRYRMGWLKLFADGALGSRSAAMLEPYSDAEVNPPTGGDRGMVLTDRAELAELLGRAAGAGISGQVHAIGDAAVRTVLDVFADVPPAPLMRRVEHAQLVAPSDVSRFGALGVAASMQPVHLRSDAHVARQAWGRRAEDAFPAGTIAAAGALIPFGTDAPVEPPDPWPGIAEAVVRREPLDAGDPPLGPRHAISLARAVRAACLDPALVAGRDDLGRLLPGYRADVLIVPAAALREPVDPSALALARPVATLIDGETAYRSTDFAH